MVVIAARGTIDSSDEQRCSSAPFIHRTYCIQLIHTAGAGLTDNGHKRGRETRACPNNTAGNTGHLALHTAKPSLHIAPDQGSASIDRRHKQMGDTENNGIIV